MNGGGLAVLIRLRRWRLDEERRLLAERLRVVDALGEELAALDAEIAGERELAAASLAADVGFAYAAYAGTRGLTTGCGAAGHRRGGSRHSGTA